MKLEDAAKKASLITGIKEEVVISVYRQFWRQIKARMDALPLKTEDIDEKTFNSVFNSFSLQYLGKLWCDYKRYQGIKKSIEIKKQRSHDKNKKD